MSKLGFESDWINRVMMCVKSIFFSILINGEPKWLITPSWGLWQGNPLSPYVFLLCTEGLIILLNKATKVKQLTCISICKGVSSINHLLFTYDSVIFFKANLVENQKVMVILARIVWVSFGSMSCFKLSNILCNDLEKLMAFFVGATKRGNQNLLGGLEDHAQTKGGEWYEV